MTNALLLVFVVAMLAILAAGSVITGGLLFEMFARAVPR
jgi:hypothetical protein